MLVKYKNYLLLHLIILIWGFTPILGKWISLPAASLVWFRIIIATLAVFFYLLKVKGSLKISLRDFYKFFGVGILIALHWVFFYHAIKVSNISVTLACFSSGTLFASLLEPIFFKRKIDRYEILFGVIVIIGLYLIFQFETKYVLGILFSLNGIFKI